MDNFFIELFKTLDPQKEVKPFATHLKHIGKKRLVNLYDYLRKLHPEFEDKDKLDPDYIFERLYPLKKHKTIDNPRKFMLNQLAELHKELNRFLVFKKLEETPDAYDLLHLEVLKERELKTRFLRKAHGIEKRLSKNKQADMWNDLMKVRLNERILSHNQFRNTAERALVLNDLMQSLSNFSLSAAYYFGTALAGHQKILGQQATEYLPFNIQLANELSARDGTSPLVKAHALAYRLIVSPSETTFLDLRQFTIKDAASRTLALSDRYELITVLLNYCAARIRGKERKYRQEAFEINAFSLEEGILLYEDVIGENKFLNIVSTACTLKRFDWVRGFINDYQQFLHPSVHLPIVQIAYATVGLEEGRPEGVLWIFDNLNFKQPFHSLRARTLCLLAKYDLRQMGQNAGLDERAIDVLRDCRNLRYFLKDNPIIKGANKKATENLVKIVGDLERGKKTKPALREVFKEMQSMLFYKDWVEERINRYPY